MRPNRLLTFDVRRTLPWLFLALGFVQAAHSIEEVATGLWKWMPVVSGEIHARLGFFPVVGWSALGFTLGNMIIIAVILGFSPFPFINHTWAWRIVNIAAIVETVNGVGHTSAALIRGEYFSGCISGAVLILVGTLIWGRRWIFKEVRR